MDPERTPVVVGVARHTYGRRGRPPARPFASPLALLEAAARNALFDGGCYPSAALESLAVVNMIGCGRAGGAAACRAPAHAAAATRGCR